MLSFYVAMLKLVIKSKFSAWLIVSGISRFLVSGNKKIKKLFNIDRKPKIVKEKPICIALSCKSFSQI